MRDLRLYYYNSGQLMKNQGGKKEYHLFKSLDECKEHIINADNRDSLKYLYSFRQFVVVEYFDKYKPKIIEVI